MLEFEPILPYTSRVPVEVITALISFEAKSKKKLKNEWKKKKKE